VSRIFVLKSEEEEEGGENLMSWVEHLARTGEMISTCNILVRKPVENRPFRRPRNRQENNITWFLETQRGRVYWTHQTRDQ
jgi:uracil-DNA glycosylase